MDMENTNTQQHFYLDGDKFKAFYETADAGNTDWRRIAEMFEVVDGASQTNVFCRKYNQKPLNSGYTYSGANAVPLIRLPEMYYILAEANYSKDSGMCIYCVGKRGSTEYRTFCSGYFLH